jgi:hypothetical protein
MVAHLDKMIPAASFIEHNSYKLVYLSGVFNGAINSSDYALIASNDRIS